MERLERVLEDLEAEKKRLEVVHQDLREKTTRTEIQLRDNQKSTADVHEAIERLTRVDALLTEKEKGN